MLKSPLEQKVNENIKIISGKIGLKICLKIHGTDPQLLIKPMFVVGN